MANLTTAQQAMLKTDINSRANLTASVTLHDWAAIANFYNTTASPVVNVATPVFTVAALNAAIHWVDYLALTNAQSSCYMAMTQADVIDMSNKSVARALCSISTAPTEGIFAFTSQSSTQILAAAQAQATYFQGLFSAVGSGTLASVNICQLDASGSSIYGQQLDQGTVQRAMGF